MNIIITGK